MEIACNYYCHDCGYSLVCSRPSQAWKFADWDLSLFIEYSFHASLLLFLSNPFTMHPRTRRERLKEIMICPFPLIQMSDLKKQKHMVT